MMTHCTVYMMKGLPASGKSTSARELVRQGFKRVSKDDLRAMLHNGVYTPELELFIRDVRNAIIKKALEQGFSVVVDDCNLNPEHEQNLRYLADYMGVSLIVVDVPTPLEECIARDREREKPVGEDVIRGMYKKYYMKGTQ